MTSLLILEFNFDVLDFERYKQCILPFYRVSICLQCVTSLIWSVGVAI